MEKDFDAWNRHKMRLNERANNLLFEEREIWWCHIGANVGHEQDGRGKKFRRPVLILRKFNRYLFLGVPLSLQAKSSNPYYYPFVVDDVERSAILSQIRLWDSRRLGTRMVKVPEPLFQEIRGAVRGLL